MSQWAAESRSRECASDEPGRAFAVNPFCRSRNDNHRSSTDHRAVGARQARGPMNYARSIAICVLLLVGPTRASAIQLTSTDTARIRSGLIAGVREGKTRAFKGISYAAPPVDSLRWRPPRPVQPWSGVRQATTFSDQRRIRAAENGTRCVRYRVRADARGRSKVTAEALSLNGRIRVRYSRGPAVSVPGAGPADLSERFVTALAVRS